jgi:hypothetical protein
MSTRKKDDFLGDAISIICHLLRSEGLTKQAAELRIRRAIDLAYKTPAATPLEARRISRLADVCARWHQEKQFIDEQGNPRSLKLSGRGRSVSALISRVVGQKHEKEVLGELVNRKLIRKTSDGTWLPKSQVVAPDGFDPAQALRGASMVARLIRTIAHNRRLRYRGDVMLEVMAQVPRLPSRELSSFRKFSKAQGISFAKSVDDWLESRNLQRNSRAIHLSREVGVVAFAFVEPRQRRTSRN